MLNPYNNPQFTAFYPLEEAKTISLNSLIKGVFNSSGTIKSNANTKVKSFCSSYNLNSAEFYDMIEKNYKFYQDDFRTNHPELTDEEIFIKQKSAFKDSTYNRISSEYSKQYLQGTNSFIWLPSDKEDTRDSHEMRYGVTYTAEDPPETLPGEEPNCGCGMQIMS